MSPRRSRLLVATTVPTTAWTLMRGQLQYLQRNGFDVVLVSSPGPLLDQTGRREGVEVRGVPMAREPSPKADLVAAWRLFRLLSVEHFDICYAGTPKAGLLAGLAGAVAHTRTRIYVLQGLRLETESGWRRVVLWLTEWITIHVAHHVVVVSPSLRDRARALRLLGKSRDVVLGRGASNGVDVDKLAPTRENEALGAAIRSALSIPEDAFIFGFVGRLTVDKGIDELIAAFARVQRQRPDAWLLVVGAEELGGLPARTRASLVQLQNARFTGWVDDTTPAYHAMNCLVLPTYREGLPNVSLEAAAAGKPVIATSATGAVDSIVDGKTGLLVQPRSADDLTAAMTRIAAHPEWAQAMGEAGKRFVRHTYANEIVWRALLDFLVTVTAVAPSQSTTSL